MNNNDYKIISISQKRQITIPQKFFTRFHFGSQAKISAIDNGILIQSAENFSNSEFDVQILQDLVQKGLNGQELINAFKESKTKIRPAVEAMLLNAKRIAHDEAEFNTLDNIFEPKNYLQ